MDDAEVPSTDRYLFITPALLQAVKDMDTTKSREVLSDFAGIVKVPQGRFYTGIKQLSGKDSESKGGYTKATGAADLNFMVIHKGALIQYTKHVAPKIITPEYNNDSDGYIFGYPCFRWRMSTKTRWPVCTPAISPWPNGGGMR